MSDTTGHRLERIKERAERVLEGEDWWLPSGLIEGRDVIEASVQTEEACARWLLKVIAPGRPRPRRRT